MSDSFAFIIHPIDPQRDVSRKYPLLGKLPVWLIDFLSLFFPPVYISEITGIQSQSNGRTAQGWFIACPLTPTRMMSLPPQVVYRKVIQTGRYAEKLGAKILGLGAFTSVVGDGGITIAQNLDIPVTTGDSYTIAIAVKAIHKAAQVMNIPLNQATIAVIGATGAIGSVSAEMLAPDARKMLLIGRRHDKLNQVADKVRSAGCRHVTISDNIQTIQEAHLIITVTSALDTIIEPQHLRQGAVVCDVARPRDISRQVADKRPDVLVIEGGMVKVPGPVNFGFDFGFPPQMAYACMAETIALTLEQKYESFTLGKDIKLSQVLTIDKIADKHGFKLSGFRSFERAITDKEINRIKSIGQNNRLVDKTQLEADGQTVVGPVPL
ncbi:MAG: shikimate dehydrogenase [Ardenticatenaceae bacterium]|nr:shikimate dehydrogenase [Ardenticatenaceae bacterium]MCB9445000.1 shikimate dehydrogenase [Ardenticatenaceae bacterium]